MKGDIRKHGIRNPKDLDLNPAPPSTLCAASGSDPRGRVSSGGKQAPSRSPPVGVWESDQLSHVECLAHPAFHKQLGVSQGSRSQVVW